MKRREFVQALGAGFLGTAALGVLFGQEEQDVRALARRYVAEGLFGGIVCASTQTPIFAEGWRTLRPPREKIKISALFDLASVGKTQTASLCALLYAEGKLDVDAPFTEYLSEHVLAKEDHGITVRDLATHSGGFDNSKPYMVPDETKMFDALYAKRPVRPRGEMFDYACSNFVYLGLIVEKLTGLDLDAAARKMLWGPLAMDHTTWNPIVGDPDAVEFDRSTYSGQGPERRIGDHNDYAAYLAPRPMGNGSCFSDAADMLRFTTDLLRREKFPQEYYDLLFTPSFDRGGYRRSFGWDMTAENSTFSHWTETDFSHEAICHTGWTGPAIAVDPKRSFAGVVLASQIAGKPKTMGPRMNLLNMMMIG
ncbi:MAG: beta-lactamase family protein [Thermoguttaceae bacterium]|nr:beta-lactamase family protein [Thermoguttaceae bacterium]